MARTAYDVNRTVRHLDVHKQFMGGLKTVDTDDALRTVYLRELKNLSLSEFGFIEKRYGIYKSEELQFVNTNGNTINPFNISGNVGLIQGYFEYVDKTKRVHKLLFIDGVPYIKDPRPGSAYPDKYRAVDLFYEEPGNDYPNVDEIEIGTGFTGVQDNSGTILVTIPILYDVHYLAKDLSQPEFHFTFTPDITYNAIDIQDQSSAFNITIPTNFTFNALTIEDETLGISLNFSAFNSNFFQAVSQLDIERGYAVNVSPNFDFADLGQIDISRNYSYDIQTNLTFNYQSFDFQTESDVFNLTFAPSVTFVSSDNTTVNNAIVSISNKTSSSVVLNVDNQNNTFAVVAHYSLTSSQPGIGDPSINIGAGGTNSVQLTGLNADQNYTVSVRLFRSVDTSYFSGAEPASFTTCIAAGTFLGYSCSGTTRINSYANGTCGTYTTTQSNSTSCGYVPPPPTLTRPNYEGANVGENSIVAEYYNPNNTSATLIVTVSLNGNFVDQSNVSIGATSNASVSFGQLSPDTSYTFSAYLTASGYQDSSSRVNTITTDPEPCDPYGTFLGYYCSGTTRINEYADGNCGTYTTSTSNSTSCGYVPPSQDCPSYGTTKEEYCVGDDLYREFYTGGTYTDSISECNTDTELIESNSTECGYTPPAPSQTDNPTVNLSSPSGGLNIFIQNNDSSTVSLSYSGTATQYFTLPSTLGPGSTFSDNTNIFPGTYNICVTATASGEDASDQVCDTQTV